MQSADFLRPVKNGVLTLTNSKKAMKKSSFSEVQILNVLKSRERGNKVSDICREFGISKQSFCDWSVKNGGIALLKLQRLKGLEALYTTSHIPL